MYDKSIYFVMDAVTINLRLTTVFHIPEKNTTYASKEEFSEEIDIPLTLPSIHKYNSICLIIEHHSNAHDVHDAYLSQELPEILLLDR